jgi:hypothetical protein
MRLSIGKAEKDGYTTSIGVRQPWNSRSDIESSNVLLCDLLSVPSLIAEVTYLCKLPVEVISSEPSRCTPKGDSDDCEVEEEDDYRP